MNESSTAFARLTNQARRRLEEISPHDLARTKPWPVIIDVRQGGLATPAKQPDRHLPEENRRQLKPWEVSILERELFVV